MTTSKAAAKQCDVQCAPLMYAAGVSANSLAVDAQNRADINYGVLPTSGHVAKRLGTQLTSRKYRAKRYRFPSR